MRWGLTRPFRIFNIRLENSFSVFPVFDPFFDPFWTPPKHPIFDPLDYAPPLRSFPGAGVSQGGYPGGLGGDLGGGGGVQGGYPKIPKSPVTEGGFPRYSGGGYLESHLSD